MDDVQIGSVEGVEDGTSPEALLGTRSSAESTGLTVYFSAASVPSAKLSRLSSVTIIRRVDVSADVQILKGSVEREGLSLEVEVSMLLDSLEIGTRGWSPCVWSVFRSRFSPAS